MTQLRDMERSAIREASTADLIAWERDDRPEQARARRAEALRELHRKLGSWKKVGDAIGLPRQDAWRAAQR